MQSVRSKKMGYRHGIYESGYQLLLQGYIIFGAKDQDEITPTVVISLIFSLLSLTFCSAMRFHSKWTRSGIADWPNQMRFNVNSMIFNFFCISFRVLAYVLILATFKAYAFLIILVPAIVNGTESRLFFGSHIWIPDLLIDIFAPTINLYVESKNNLGEMSFDPKKHLYKYQFELGVYTSYHLTVIILLIVFQNLGQLDHPLQGSRLESWVLFEAFSCITFSLGILSLLTFVSFWKFSLKPLLIYCQNLNQ